MFPCQISLVYRWPETFAVPDKKAQTVAGQLLTDIIPRFGTPLELVSDNGPENVNKIMRQTVESLNIKLIVTSPYHLQSNAKVERFHRFLGDTLAKPTDEEKGNWDLFLTQTLGTMRFSINEVTRFSPISNYLGKTFYCPLIIY